MLNSSDRIAYGCPDYPECIFATTLGFSFKNFDLSMLWSGVTNVSRLFSELLPNLFALLYRKGLVIYCNIWLIKGVPPKLRDEDGFVFYDKLGFRFLQMPFFNKTEDELVTHYDKWCYFLKHLETFDDIPQILNEPLFDKAFKTAALAAMSPKERKEYKQRWLDYAGMKAAMDTPKDEGREEGREEGIENRNPPRRNNQSTKNGKENERKRRTY